MSPTKPLRSVRATAEPPWHHPRSIASKGVDILAYSQWGEHLRPPNSHQKSCRAKATMEGERTSGQWE
eukprot:scaffold5400_cov105-Skeletonema_dohrnii-CCMP3373.AAC.3